MPIVFLIPIFCGSISTSFFLSLSNEVSVVLSRPLSLCTHSHEDARSHSEEACAHDSCTRARRCWKLAIEAVRGPSKKHSTKRAGPAEFWRWHERNEWYCADSMTVFLGVRVCVGITGGFIAQPGGMLYLSTQERPTSTTRERPTSTTPYIRIERAMLRSRRPSVSWISLRKRKPK